MKINPDKFFTKLGATALMLVVFAVGATSASAADGIKGSGSTLISPLVSSWTSYLKFNVTYGGGGSGKGISDVSSGVVDFGATDAPMTADQKAACVNCKTVPVSLSAIAVTYNVPGLGNGLKLSPKVLAGIYKGTITNWNSSAIKKLNKGKSLPDLAITPVHRSDGSGSTYAFTDFLKRSNVGWKPVGALIEWAGGPAASGSGGVATAVKTTEGAIAYVGVDYAIPNKLTVAAVGNKAGKYILPGQKSIRAGAAWVKKVPSSGVIHPVAPPKKYKTAYPIDAPSYIITKKGGPNAALVRQMINFALGSGLGYRQDIGFAPLPKVVVKYGKKVAKTL